MYIFILLYEVCILFFPVKYVFILPCEACIYPAKLKSHSTGAFEGVRALHFKKSSLINKNEVYNGNRIFINHYRIKEISNQLRYNLLVYTKSKELRYKVKD